MLPFVAWESMVYKRPEALDSKLDVTRIADDGFDLVMDLCCSGKCKSEGTCLH